MNLNPSLCKVALLSGGTSRERDISLASGDGAQAALEEAGFCVTRLDPARKEDLIELINGDYDVAFLCLHGKNGEDGTVQGMLDLVGLPYTGSDVLASATAMNKSQSKIIYRDAHLPVIPGVDLRADEPFDISALIETVGIPCVVKPATEGSSLGLHIVEKEEDLQEAIAAVFKVDEFVVVETYIEGTETTVAILGNDETRALPVIEIVPLAGSTYDFESKYAEGGCKHICPARLSKETSALLQDMARRAHRALGCSGVSRTDFIVDKQGKPWILETNTLPGMTAKSLLPDTAQVAGISFPELCTMLIEYAFDRMN